MKCSKCGYTNAKLAEDLALFVENGNNGGKANTHFLGIVRVELCNLCMQKLYSSGKELKKEEKPWFIALLLLVFGLLIYFTVVWNTQTRLTLILTAFAILVLASNVKNQIQIRQHNKKKTEAYTIAKSRSFDGSISMTEFIDSFDDVAIKTRINARAAKELLDKGMTPKDVLQAESVLSPIVRSRPVYVNRRLGTVAPTSSYTYIPIKKLEEAHQQLTGQPIDPKLLTLCQNIDCSLSVPSENKTE